MFRKILHLWLILPVLISSCSLTPGKVLGEFINPTQTQTPLPTATPLPSPTPMPTSVSIVRVTQGDKALAEGDFEGALTQYQLELNSAK